MFRLRAGGSPEAAGHLLFCWRMTTRIPLYGGMVLGLLVTFPAATACGPGSGVYCQSGSKYGTDCYAEPDVREPPGQPRRPEEAGPRKGEPPATPPPNQVKW